MPHKRIVVILAAALLLTACATTTRLYPAHPSPRLGTVAPAYQVGDKLSPGIKAISHIPIEKLSTAGSAALDKQDPCRSVPPAVVTPANFPGKPIESSRLGCDRFGAAGLALRVSDFPARSMAREVTAHVDMANGRVAEDQLAHLAWLLIDGHYAIERILKYDESSACWLGLNLNSPSIAFVVVNAIDLARQKPAVTSPGDALAKFCPRARTVAQNLLHHLLEPFGPPGASVVPTR